MWFHGSQCPRGLHSEVTLGIDLLNNISGCNIGNRSIQSLLFFPSPDFHRIYVIRTVVKMTTDEGRTILGLLYARCSFLPIGRCGGGGSGERWGSRLLSGSPLPPGPCSRVVLSVSFFLKFPLNSHQESRSSGPSPVLSAHFVYY